MKHTCLPFSVILLLALPFVLLSHTEVQAQLNKDLWDISDSNITLAVEKKLGAHTEVPAWSIDVTTSNNVVILGGSVSSYAERQRAGQIAGAVEGVIDVDNKLQVTKGNVQDSKLKQYVQEALASLDAPGSTDITASVQGGVVTLGGTAPAMSVVASAKEVTGNLKGVRALNSEITIVPQNPVADQDIRQRIMQRMQMNDLLRPLQPEFTVKAGKVTITGELPSYISRQEAIKAASTAGVTSINAEQLKVVPQQGGSGTSPLLNNISDETIRDYLKVAFDDAFYRAQQPEIAVNSGRVTLSGSVLHWDRRLRMERIARDVPGVTAVNNNLAVTAETATTDDRLASLAMLALDRNPFVNPENLSAEVKNGEVYLGGLVRNYFSKQQAGQVVAQIRGLKAVHNNINVNDNLVVNDVTGLSDWYREYSRDPIVITRREDAFLKDEIEYHLWWSPWVDEEEVNVEVNEGKALLTGTVDSQRERSRATANALEAGALEVVNRLQVQ